MRILFIAATFVATISTRIDASERHSASTTMLSAELAPLYSELNSDTSKTNIIGRHLDLILALKTCSERWLLFKDTRIVIDNNSSYHLIKWIYTHDTIKSIDGKTDIKCRVKASIVDVIRDETSPYPYAIAKIKSIEEVEPK